MAKWLGHQFKYYFLGLLFLATVFVWYAVIAETRNGLEVAFLDIGQGDAIFIQAPSGNQILIDGGPPNKAVIRQLSKIMPFYDKAIDGVILTHKHLDHYGGLNGVLAKYKVNFEMDPQTKNSDAGFLEFEELLGQNKVKRFYARRGMRINLDKNLFLEMLLPAINDENLSAHDGMIVARLVYGQTSFLLTGDMENNLENYLLWIGGSIKSNVLKVGHHGSKTSSSENFLVNADPDLAIISAGAKNRYGHPHKEVTERLEKFEIPVLRTDKLGTIRIYSDGDGVSILK